MLRVGGYTIINLKELQYHADLWQIYNQMEQFEEFAEVHCLPIVLLLNNGDVAECLDKSFWLRVLKERDNLQKRFDKQKLCVNECIDIIRDVHIAWHEQDERRKQFIEAGICDVIDWNLSWEDNVEQAILSFEKTYRKSADMDEKEIEKGIKEIRDNLKVPYNADKVYMDSLLSEIKQENIQEKLKKLSDNVRKKNEDAYVAILLLAISMLTEIEPVIEGVITEKKLTSSKTNAGKAEIYLPGKQKQKIVNSKHKDRIPELMPPLEVIGKAAMREKIEKLKCRSIPYTWCLYESEKLPDKAIIQTVKIVAVRSVERNCNARIQLYSESMHKVVWEFFLKPGEYRYCNITEGKIICFLPTMSISEDIGIYRPRYYSSDLRVQTRAGKDEIQLEYGSEVSNYSAGKDGEVYLRKGRVMAGRYILAQNNNRIADKIEALSYESFVEVRLVDKGFIFLSNTGKIRSNIPELDGKAAVCLCTNDWMKQACHTEKSKIREFCMDEKGNNLIAHFDKTDMCKIYWSGTARIFEDVKGNLRFEGL